MKQSLLGSQPFVALKPWVPQPGFCGDSHISVYALFGEEITHVAGGDIIKCEGQLVDQGVQES